MATKYLKNSMTMRKGSQDKRDQVGDLHFEAGDREMRIEKAAP